MKLLLLLFLALLPNLSAAPNFIPPSNAKCVEALGDLDGIDYSIRPIFINTAEIAPIPSPGPIDWLSTRAETGQTYAQFRASNFKTPDKNHPFLYLQPIGENHLPADETSFLAQYCSAFFNTEVKILKTLEIDPSRIRSRTNSFTNEAQLHAGDILDVLDQNRPRDAYAVIGFTLTDLYPDQNWNFVFGLANLRDSVGVFSFARYGDLETEPDLFRERALKVMSHEIGHMYGLKHCVYYHCLMNGSNSLDETDRAPMHLCPVCLRKLHYATNPDHLMRYTKLKKLYQNANLQAPANFARNRVELILKATLN